MCNRLSDESDKHDDTLSELRMNDPGTLLGLFEIGEAKRYALVYKDPSTELVTVHLAGSAETLNPTGWRRFQDQLDLQRRFLTSGEASIVGQIRYGSIGPQEAVLSITRLRRTRTSR
jgi:hypothetical protein